MKNEISKWWWALANMDRERIITSAYEMEQEAREMDLRCGGDFTLPAIDR